MTSTEEHVRGWALAPARLPREDVRTLRRLYTEAHAAPVDGPLSIAVLHVDREDQRKLALSKLGVDAPQVRLQAAAKENNIVVSVIAAVSRDEWTSVANHKFRRSTPVNEWTRILGRHCRHALGVLAHLRTRTLAQVFFPSGVSKVS